MDKSIRKNLLLSDFAYSIGTADSYQNSFAAIDRLVNSLGYDGVLYTFIPRFSLGASTTKQPVYSVSDDFSADFISHYMEARFDQQDAMINAIRGGNLHAMNWWEEVRSGKLSLAEKHVLDTARYDYGVENGITVPLLAGRQGIAGASVISSDTDRIFEKHFSLNQGILEICLKLFHQRVMIENWKTKVFVEPLVNSFTRNETVVLQGTLAGKSAKSIASDTGISIKYVEKTIRQLRLKIGGENEFGNPNISTAELIYHVGLLSLVF